jgi:hypothetical protein
MLPEITVVGGSLVKVVGDKVSDKVIESALERVFQRYVLPYATSPKVKDKLDKLISVLADKFPGSLQEKAAILLMKAFEHLESLAIPVKVPETKIVVSILDAAILEEEPTLNQCWKHLLSLAFSGHSLDPGFPGILKQLTPEDAAILDELDQPRWRQFSVDSLTSGLGVSCQLVKRSLAKFQSLALCEQSSAIYDTTAVPRAGPQFRPMPPPGLLSVAQSQYQLQNSWSLSEYGRDFLTVIRGPQQSADPEADRLTRLSARL